MLIHGRVQRGTTAVRLGEHALGTVHQPVSPQQCRMLGFHRILLVADNTSCLASILCAARMLVERSEGEILILEAEERGSIVPRAVQQAIRENGIGAVDTREISRPTISAGSIEGTVRRYDCDLAILTIQAQSVGDRLVSGNLGEETFRRLSCPVLAFGPSASPFPQPEGIGRPVICATSFHRGNTASIAVGSRIARLCDAPLECVHVLPENMAEDTQGCHVVPEIMRSALIVDAKRNRVMLTAEQCHILFGTSVSKAVTGYAKKREAQFIVLGIQHGGSFAAHLPIGVASSIVASAPCPVLMIAGQE